MITVNDVSFGRLTPPKEKYDLHVARYSYSLFFPLVIKEQLEVTWPLPDLREHYNQGRTNGCTGYSASWMSSIYNKIAYDAAWLYHRGQETDKDPNTTPARDNGGYVYAVMDVLRKEGHKEPGGQVEPKHGIESYGWVHTTEELRSALSRGPVVFGLPWYEEFMTPRTVNGEYWIGTRSKWGSMVGGHAITGYQISDSREAVRLVNSLGTGYPDVWISYKSIEKLFGEWGECAAPIDKPDPAPPPPEPEPEPESIRIDRVEIFDNQDQAVYDWMRL